MFMVIKDRHGKITAVTLSNNRHLAHHIVETFAQDCQSRQMVVDRDREDEYCRWWIMTDAAGHTVYEVDLVHTLPETAVAS